MYCRHCGKQIDDDALYCTHCGKSQRNEKANAENGFWYNRIAYKFSLLSKLNRFIVIAWIIWICCVGISFTDDNYCWGEGRTTEHFVDFVAFGILAPILIIIGLYFIKYLLRRMKGLF